MSDFGVTKDGFIRKRFDTIYGEIQSDIKEQLGIDISVNPKSYLNVLVSSIADKLAAAWEVAEDTYYSHYPSTAEGVNLDYACQFGGLSREEDQRTNYTILCTGDDGAVLPKGTRIGSDTTPQIYFQLYKEASISRSSFNTATLKLIEVSNLSTYTVYIDEIPYTYYSSNEAMENEILEGIKNAIATATADFVVSVDTGEKTISIVAKNEASNHNLILSDNMTTVKIGSLIGFQSEEYGKVSLPSGNINKIITTSAGFDSCVNIGSPIYGRLRETDIEYRQSYIKKKSARSNSMLASIEGAILDNVEYVVSCTVYENETSETDAYGRPPHSIEVIVDGGDDLAIGQQILNYKAAGIQTYGSVSVDVPGLYSDTIKVRFNRPALLDAWIKVELVKNPAEAMPPNYEELIKNSIMEQIVGVKAGDTVVLQKYIPAINEVVSGIAYISILGALVGQSGIATASEEEPADEMYKPFIQLGVREKPNFDADRITVVLREG